MKVSLCLLVILFVSTSAFAVGDVSRPMSNDFMNTELELYKAVIDNTPCKNLMPVSGVISGGGLPGLQSYYETMQLAMHAKLKPSAQLTISWLLYGRSRL